jgi:sugar phosphate permease
MTAGFVLFLPIDASWAYAAFILPIVLVAAGMAFSNGPCSAIGTSSVPEEQVGSASGISNMARYVGAAVMTAIVAAVYSAPSADEAASGGSAEDLADAFARSSLVLAVISASGIALALLAARHRPPKPMAVDLAAAAAASVHTLPVPRDDAPERALATVGTPGAPDAGT